MTNDTNQDSNVPGWSFRAAQDNSLPMWLELGAPVLPAYPASADMLWVMCPWCEAPHYHGRRDGHRFSHCRDLASPFRWTGYILREVPVPADGCMIAGLAPSGRPA